MNYKIAYPVFSNESNRPDLYDGTEIDITRSIEVLKDGNIAGAMGEASIPVKGEKFNISLKDLLRDYIPALRGKDTPLKVVSYLSKD